MVYPAQIFLFVGFVYLMLCGGLQWLAHMLLAHHEKVSAR
jgi:polar amino acid transport system permease protein